MVCTDYTYDLQSWDIRITLESTYSTHANRRGSDDFTLKLRDVCWDLPLTAPVLSQAEYALYLWDVNAGQAGGISDVITISSPMDISWVDPNYCGGFSYKLTYISGEANSAKFNQVDGGGVPITNA